MTQGVRQALKIERNSLSKAWKKEAWKDIRLATEFVHDKSPLQTQNLVDPWLQIAIQICSPEKVI